MGSPPSEVSMKVVQVGLEVVVCSLSRVCEV